MKHRHLKYGVYSIVLSAVFIAVAIMVNLLISVLPQEYTNFDTSGRDLFSIGSTARQRLDALESDITLYYVVNKGGEDALVEEFINRYADLSDKVTVKKHDPAVYPSVTTASQKRYDLTEIEYNSVIVSGAKQDVLVDYSSMYREDYAADYAYTGEMETYFCLEQGLTSGILYVNSDSIPTIYNLKGHSESEFGTSLSYYIQNESYVCRDITLSSQNVIPEEVKLISINQPLYDITEAEKDMLIGFINNGGKVILVTDYADNTSGFENINALCAHYGMIAQQGLCYEADSEHISSNGGIIPDVLSTHPITADLVYLGVSLPLYDATAFTVSDDIRDGVELTKLLTTTESAYTCEITDAAAEDENINKIYEGECVLGAVAEEGEGCFVWFSSPSVTDDSAGENAYAQLLYLCAVTELGSVEKESVTIDPKAMNIQKLTLSEKDTSFWSIVLIAVVPAAVLGMGGWVCYYRRRK